MPNNRHAGEHNQTRSSPYRAELDSAVLLLRQALGPQTVIERQPSLGRESLLSDEVVVQWPGAIDGPARLRLVPWGASLGASGTSLTETSVPTTTGAPVVWVLPRASAAQRGALRARGESFIDLSGAVSLRLPWILVDREGLSPARPATLVHSKADPFADRSSLVLRAMLENRESQRTWGVRELAELAGVGLATASDALNVLAARNLVQITRRGRASEVSLVSPVALLDAWTRAYDWQLNQGIVVHAPIGDPARFLRRLPRLMHPRYRWALTLQAGASVVAPHATWNRVHLYVDIPRADRADTTHVLTAIAERAGWPAGADGGLVLMAPYYATSAWYGLRTVDGLPVVSDLQLVLDLWHYPLRGREQAEHLLRRIASAEHDA